MIKIICLNRGFLGALVSRRGRQISGKSWCGREWSGLSTEETRRGSLGAQEGSAGERVAASELREAKSQREFGQIGGEWPVRKQRGGLRHGRISLCGCLK